MGIGSRVCINFERVGHPCYRPLLSAVRSPSIGVQNVTSGRRPLSRRVFLVGLASRRRMWTDVIVRVHVHSANQPERYAKPSRPRRRDRFAGFDATFRTGSIVQIATDFATNGPFETVADKKPVYAVT